MVTFSLHKLVQKVRDELVKIRDDPEAQKNPLMVLSGLELELEVEVTADAQGSLSFKLWGMGAEVGGGGGGSRTSRVKLAFEPLPPTSPPSAGGGGKTQHGTTGSIKGILPKPLDPTKIYLDPVVKQECHVELYPTINLGKVKVWDPLKMLVTDPASKPLPILQCDMTTLSVEDATRTLEEISGATGMEWQYAIVPKNPGTFGPRSEK